MGLKEDNAARWAKVKVTKVSSFDSIARRLLINKPRYQEVEKKTGVPWFVIAVIHQRESSGSFAGVLHNGERIIGTNQKTTLVPKGRGPFKTWGEAAVDALINCHPYAAKNKDWSIGGTLTLLEKYNGLGYYNRGLPSPYIWAGTNQYSKGKFVRDGVFDPNHVDEQLGCAGLIKTLMTLDPTIKFGGVSSGSVATIGATAAVVAGASAATQTGVTSQALIAIAVFVVVVVGFIIYHKVRK